VAFPLDSDHLFIMRDGRSGTHLAYRAQGLNISQPTIRFALMVGKRSRNTQVRVGEVAFINNAFLATAERN
jgi:hypothetical protein